MIPGSRVLVWLIALVVGGVYGVACTIAHAYTVGPVQVGLILAVVGIVALLVALRTLTGDRWAALAAGAGAVATTLLFSGTGPGGSVVVPGGPLGVVWSIAVPVLSVAVVAWPDLRRNGRRGGPPSAN